MTPFSIPTQASKEKAAILDSLSGRFYSCYQEFYRSDRILVDHQAARAFPEIIKDFPKLKELYLCQRVSQLTSVIRTRWFDQAVVDFLNQSPDAVVVNLKSRLCTRYWRLPTPHEWWYEVDTKTMMELRQRYFTIVPRNLDIVCDCMDFGWMSHVQRYEGQPVLILLEGMSMYLTEQENRALFEAIAKHFGPVHLLFDTVSSKFISDRNEPLMHQSENFLGERQAQFCWGMDSLSDLQSWAIQARVIQKIEYLLDIVHYPERLEPWMVNFWPMLEPLLKSSGKIYHLALRE